MRLPMEESEMPGSILQSRRMARDARRERALYRRCREGARSPVPPRGSGRSATAGRGIAFRYFTGWRRIRLVAGLVRPSNKMRDSSLEMFLKLLGNLRNHHNFFQENII